MSRHCPQCRSVLQPFWAGDVELDRCGGCGGLWFDWGELERVVGRPLAPEPLDGVTSRRCAFCGITLAPAVLPGGVPVETCTACRGIYLDAGELRELGGSEPEPPLAAALEQVGEFDCVRCGKRLPLTEGNAVRDGLACDGCTPQVVPMPRLSASTRVGGRSFIDLLLWLLPV